MVATLVIIAITCVVSFMAFGNRKLLDDLILWPPAISRGKQYYRLLTYGFIHADGTHLLFNMFTLYFFGSFSERFVSGYIGILGYVAFYLPFFVANFSMIGLVVPFTSFGLAKYLGLKIIKVGFICSGISSDGFTNVLNN